MSRKRNRNVALPRGHDMSDRDIVNAALKEPLRVHRFHDAEMSMKQRCLKLEKRGLLKKAFGLLGSEDEYA